MNKLKQLIRISAFLLSIAGMAACSQDEQPLPDKAGNHMRLGIRVSDSGFTGMEAKNTRASENGYATVFTAGDKIGLYAVKGGQVTQANVCVTLNDAGVWTLPAEVTLYDIPGTDYYAYYPYQAVLSGTVDAQAGNADAFYADLIRNWDIDTDQSTYTLYTAQDLMVGSGAVLAGSVPDTKNLSFSLYHKMALAVINLPKVKYTFFNTAPLVPEYIIPIPGLAFKGFSPYQVERGTYRYLVKPGASSGLTGKYRKEGILKEFAVDASGILSGSYKTYKVDGAAVTQRQHTLAIGDFLLKDGSLLAGNSTLTPQEQAQVAGVVYWVGNPCSPNPGSSFSGDNYDKLLSRDYPGCTHGLVVSLSEGKSVWDASYQDVSSWFESNKGNFPDCQSLDVWDGNSLSSLGNTIMGYNNTRILSDFNSSHPSTQVLSDAFVYLSSLPSVVGGSDWYLPSIKELSLMCSGDYSGNIGDIYDEIKVRDLLNIQFPKVGGSVFQTNYWSSSECVVGNAFAVYFPYAGVSFTNKANSFLMRGVLAF